MENHPNFVVPYHDPHDTPLTPRIFNMDNPTLADLTTTNNYNNINIFNPTLVPPPPQQNHHHGVAQEVNHSPFFDPMIQDQFVLDNNSSNFPIGGGGGVSGNFEAGPLHSQVQMNQVQPATMTHDDTPGLQGYNDVMILNQWPQQPAPFSCSCCLVLREIVHTNGINFSKLEIHGRPGLISHAIQHPTVNVDYSSSSDLQYQMIDFCNRTIEDVKNFLVRYCKLQSTAGYFILQDPLSAYYEALCVGMEWAEELSDDTDDLNTNDDDNEQEADNRGGSKRKTSLSAQRDKAGNMHLDDLTDYFHLTIEEASKRVNLCPTVVKKICRRDGLSRWPYRKIRSIAKKISALKRTLESSDDGRVGARIQAEICKLVTEIKENCAGRYPTALIIP